jgi:hypothetical protein
MKNIFRTLIIIITAIISSNKTFAQEDKNLPAYSSFKAADMFPLFADKKYFSEVRLNDLNIKAVRHFVKNYQGVNTEQWYKISDGFIASFTKDSIQTKVVYDLKGNWHCTLNAFDENRLSPDIRNKVKNKYYDFNILVAYQIIFEEDVIYIIKIDNATKLKILKIADGEIEVAGDYVKQ